jgi:protein-L-isoaspartate(D-aspartate) O-methyltransferase
MEKLLDEIINETEYTAYFTGINKLDERVINAFLNVDRAMFVLDNEKTLAYADCPLPIGHGQTISQPFIVVLMTEALEVKPEHKVLEVGSGSGYQLAILAKLAREVYGIEFISDLAKLAEMNLKKAGINNAKVRTGDGTAGLLEHAPFDRIMVTAAAQEIPTQLIEQLKVGGIMVIPKSTTVYDQMLLRITKTDQHTIKIENLLPVRFVPLVNS